LCRLKLEAKIEKNPAFKVAVGSFLIVLVFLSTILRLDIYLNGSTPMLSFGNVIALAIGLLFSPTFSALTSGLGFSLFDIFFPQYIFSLPFTFLSKFCMVFVCSLISKKKFKFKNKNLKDYLAIFIAFLVFSVLRTFKVFIFNLIILKLEFLPNLILVSENLFFCLINLIIALVLVVPLNKIIKKALNKIS
jgi:uncharacterized membrane protein